MIGALGLAVIPDLIRDPWIAGQARNDNVTLPRVPWRCALGRIKYRSVP